MELEDVERPRLTPRPCVYVGQSVYPPAIRFDQHKSGYKHSRAVRRYGKKLRPDLTAGIPCTRDWDITLERESALAATLRQAGYWVHGGQ